MEHSSRNDNWQSGTNTTSSVHWIYDTSRADAHNCSGWNSTFGFKLATRLVVVGDAIDIGAAIMDSNAVRKLTLTDSTNVWKILMAASGKTIRKAFMISSRQLLQRQCNGDKLEMD